MDITPDIVAEQNPIWKECIVGHYVGRKVPFKLTEEAVKKTWGDQVTEVKLHENGFYFFRVPDEVHRRKILDLGPISIFSSTMLLQHWHPKLKLKKGAMNSLPVWVRLREVPFSLWSSAGIGRIASAIGKPLYVDNQTENMTRISYARVCVEIKAAEPRLETVKVRWDGDVYLVHVEFEWKPIVCTPCGLFGHKTGTSGFECAHGSTVEATETASHLQGKARPQASTRPLQNEVWTQVTRKKGKGHSSSAAAHSNLAPVRIVEASPSEKSVPFLAPGPSLTSSRAGSPDMTGTASTLPLEVNTGGRQALPYGHDSSLVQVCSQVPSDKPARPATVSPLLLNTEDIAPTSAAMAKPQDLQQLSSDMISKDSAGPGTGSSAPVRPLPANSEGVAHPVTGLQSVFTQEVLGAVLRSPEAQNDKPSPLEGSGPLGHPQQLLEDLEFNANSSSEGSLTAQEGGESSDSEGQIMGKHTFFSPPTTRSRSLASFMVEDPAKASMGHGSSSNCPNSNSGPSSLKKNKKRRSRKARK